MVLSGKESVFGEGEAGALMARCHCEDDSSASRAHGLSS